MRGRIRLRPSRRLGHRPGLRDPRPSRVWTCPQWSPKPDPIGPADPHLMLSPGMAKQPGSRNGTLSIHMSDWSDNILVTDLADEPHLSEELNLLIDRLVKASGEQQSVVVNFSNVTYVSSSNLAQLLKLHKVLAEKSCELRLCGVRDGVG